MRHARSLRAPYGSATRDDECALYSFYFSFASIIAVRGRCAAHRVRGVRMRAYYARALANAVYASGAPMLAQMSAQRRRRCRLICRAAMFV